MKLLRHHARSIAALAAPLLINNLGVGGMLSADTIMAGRLGPDALAAVAVGANFIGIFHFAAIGTLMALSPLVAHAFGARRHDAIGSLMRQGLWLALLLSVVLVPGLLLARPVLLLIDVPLATAELASRYVAAFAFGVPALCGFYALRFGSEGIGWTRPVMYTAVVGLASNIALNWVLMYGHFGLPALGAVGTGFATAITWWLLFAMLWVYVKRHAVYVPYAPLRQREALRPATLREITRLGAPIAGSLVLEGGMFNAAALLLASLGAAVIAAHAIAINYAALMFMIPLSLNSATTIHVGHCLGAGDARGARRGAFIGVAMGIAVMAVSATVMVFGRDVDRRAVHRGSAGDLAGGVAAAVCGGVPDRRRGAGLYRRRAAWLQGHARAACRQPVRLLGHRLPARLVARRHRGSRRARRVDRADRRPVRRGRAAAVAPRDHRPAATACRAVRSGIAAAHRLYLGDASVLELHSPQQLIRAEVVGPVFDLDLDVAARDLDRPAVTPDDRRPQHRPAVDVLGRAAAVQQLARGVALADQVIATAHRRPGQGSGPEGEEAGDDRETGGGGAGHSPTVGAGR